MIAGAAGSPQTDREDERVLFLNFECLQSMPEGMSEVTLWYDRHLGCRRVGKKIDLSNMVIDDSLPEGSTLESIDHPNVVRIVSAADVSGYPEPMRVIELITPYYERGSITDALLRDELFAATEALSVVRAALRGLSELHEVHQICHRDVKSGNILLSGDRHVAKVADLGLAGRFDVDGCATAVVNPTLYSPPEFPAGVLTRASDIYPMALVLRELLGGAFPYSKYTTTSVVQRLARNRSPLDKADLVLPVWVSSSVRRVYNRALQRDPSRRFQSAAEMDDALSRCVAVDWREVGPRRWEAPFAHQHGKMIAVEAKPKRRGGYSAAVLVNASSGWRRRGDAVDVPDLSTKPFRDLFDHASITASVR